MSDVRLLYSEALDTQLYAYRLFPAIAAILAAFAIYPLARRRLADLSPSFLDKLVKVALPVAGAPGVLLIVLRVASISRALNPYLSVVGGLLLAIAGAAALAPRLIAPRPGENAATAPAAAVCSAAAGAGVFLLSMLLMLGLMQLPKYSEPIVCLLGIVAPLGLTVGLAGGPVARQALAATPRTTQLAGGAAGAGGCALLAVVFLSIVGLPRQLPAVSVVAMTAFPLAAAAGLKAARHVPLKTYGLLTALRMLIVAGLVMFLARPMLSIRSEVSEKPTLAFAVDTSASMSARDGANAPTRLEWAKQTLGRRYLGRLEKDFNIACYSFSGGTQEVGPREIRDLPADGKTTDIAQAVAHIRSALPAADIASIVVVSDGIDNSGGRDPVKTIVEQGVVVNTVGVGALAEDGQIKDIAIKRVDSPRYVTVDNVAEIKVYVESSGIVGRTNVALKSDGRELAGAALLLEPGRKTQVATLRFTPEAVGRFDFEVSVANDPEERIHQNNSYPFSVIVADPRIRVIYIEGSLRHEYKFLKRTLDMDPNVELLSFVQTRKDVFLKQGAPGAGVELLPTDLEALKKFDVIILGDTDSTLFSGRQFDMIAQAVREGAGFLMLGGEAAFGPGGYADTPVADLLPVRLGGRGDRQFKDAFMLQLTDDGKAHPIFQGTLEFFAGPAEAPDKALPQLGGSTEVLGRKPGASVLAVNPDKTAHDGNPMIVVAAQQYGAGRTVAFTADTTWRWLFQMKGMGRETPYVKFWGQAIRWLAREEVKAREQKPGITAFADRRAYDPGEEVHIFASARVEGGLATNDALLYASIAAPAGTKTPVQLTYVPGTAGEYEGTFEPPAPGGYAVTVSATLNDEPLGEKVELDFRVGSPNLEFDALDLNERLLKRIASETGGQYRSLIRLDDLIGNLRTAERLKRSHREVSLWDYLVMPVVDVTRGIGFLHRFLSFLAKDPQGMFFVFLVLVAAEWTIRKRRMLS